MAKKRISEFDRNVSGTIIGQEFPKAPEKPVEPPVKITSGGNGQVEVIRNEQGGITGLKTPQGDILSGLTDKQARDMISVYAKQQETPTGSIEATTAAEQRAAQEAGANLAAQVGNVDQNMLSNIEASQPNLGSAIGAGLTGAGVGAAGGAAAGTIFTGGAGTLPGAVIGAIGAAVTGTISNLKGQLSGEISTAGATQSEVEANLRAIITDTNRNPQNAATNLELFNYQLSLLDQKHAKLKLETQRDLNKYLGKTGKSELYKFELFNTRGGSREFLINKMQVALVNPNPNSIDVTLEELQGVQNE